MPVSSVQLRLLESHFSKLEGKPLKILVIKHFVAMSCYNEFDNFSNKQTILKKIIVWIRY